MTATGRTERGHSQGLLPGLLRRWQGSADWGHHPLFLPGALARSWIPSGAARTDFLMGCRHYSMQASPTTPAPKTLLFFKIIGLIKQNMYLLAQRGHRPLEDHNVDKPDNDSRASNSTNSLLLHFFSDYHHLITVRK